MFEIVNRLHDAILEGHGWDVLKETLDELVHYTLEHFQIEAILMETTCYPAYPEHKEKYELLKQQVTDSMEKLNQHKQFLTLEVSPFLTNWLIHHIKGDDQKMIQFMKRNHPATVEQKQAETTQA